MRADEIAMPAGVAGGAADVPARGAVRVIRVGTPTAFALAVLSGMAYAAGFPPFSRPLAPWLALVPLLVACAVLSPGRAALAGMCWAITAACGVASFLPGMLAGYFGLATTTSWLAAMAVAGALHGIYVSAWAAWVAWLARRRRASPLLVAGGWLACEFARAHDGLSSPWALVAYSQLSWTPVVQIADLAGPYGIGMLVAGVNACIAASVTPALRGRRPALAALTVAVALLSTCLYGQWRLAQPMADGEPLRVAVVQAGAPVTGEAERAERLARHVTMTTRDADPDADLIVWPEYAVDGYLDEASPARDAVLGLSASTRADIVLGGPHYASAPDGTQYHNSAYLVRHGRIAGRYDKHRLVPFAEDGRLARFGAGATYTPGPDAFVLPGRIRLGALLCVEAMFPDLAREAAVQGAELLVTLSNDAWFGHAEPARHQLEIAALRAVETRRYLVRAAVTGFSAVIDPFGRTLTESEYGTHQVLNATVRTSHVRTPYQRWGDAFAWVVIAGVVGSSLRSFVRNTNPRRKE